MFQSPARHIWDIQQIVGHVLVKLSNLVSVTLILPPATSMTTSTRMRPNGKRLQTPAMPSFRNQVKPQAHSFPAWGKKSSSLGCRVQNQQERLFCLLACCGVTEVASLWQPCWPDHCKAFGRFTKHRIEHKAESKRKMWRWGRNNPETVLLLDWSAELKRKMKDF